LLLLASSPVLAAGNPFIGTWKENIDKSFNADQPTQSAVISIESVGGNKVKITQDIVNATGNKSRSVEEYPLDGVEIHTNPNVTRSFRSISPNVWERILNVSGEIRDGYWAVSSDGKMMIITGFGKDPKSKAPYYFQRVFERQ
jgi:hypothetical protein